MLMKPYSTYYEYTTCLISFAVLYLVHTEVNIILNNVV